MDFSKTPLDRLVDFDPPPPKRPPGKNRFTGRVGDLVYATIGRKRLYMTVVQPCEGGPFVRWSRGEEIVFVECSGLRMWTPTEGLKVVESVDEWFYPWD